MKVTRYCLLLFLPLVLFCGGGADAKIPYTYEDERNGVIRHVEQLQTELAEFGDPAFIEEGETLHRDALALPAESYDFKDSRDLVGPLWERYYDLNARFRKALYAQEKS